jgi:competence protein ComEC
VPPTTAGTPTVPPTTPSTVPPATPPVTPPEPTPDGSSFEIHFIDVGQADAALVLCDGEAMLIDGGNAADSNLMYTYLKDRNINHLKYVVGTHAHEDHIGGIPGALRFATVDTVYCPSKTYSTKAFQNFLSAVRNQGKNLIVPTIGTTFNLGSATCTILAVNTDNKDMNNTSIVMRMVYGENSFLFTGDAEDVVEKVLLDKGVTLKSDVLKVGHHGSNYSTTYSFLREVMPEYAVICVGADNDYGHPTSNVLSRLRDADVTTFRTDKHGDVICKSDGKNITFTPSKNATINPYIKIGPNSTQS